MNIIKILVGVLLMLPLLTAIILVYPAEKETIIVECYDRDYNEIIDVKCYDDFFVVDFYNTLEEWSFLLALFFLLGICAITVGVIDD